MTKQELKEAMLNEQLYDATYHIKDAGTLRMLLQEALWQMYRHGVEQKTIFIAIGEEWFEEE